MTQASWREERKSSEGETGREREKEREGTPRIFSSLVVLSPSSVGAGLTVDCGNVRKMLGGGGRR